MDLAGWIERRVLQALREESDASVFPRELFVTATRGACPLSPVTLLTLVIVGTLRGVTSLRGLERFARLDLRGIWILGGWCPDHSTLGRFLERLHGKVSEPLFEHLTVEALRAVGKRVCDVSLDGTVVCAVASRYGRLHADAIAERLERAQRHAAVAPEDAKVAHALEQARACAQALASQQQARQEVGRDPASIQICPSEPEAVTHKTKEGAFHPAYVASVTATPERFLVGVDVDARDELVSVEPMLEQAMAISARVHAALSAASEAPGATTASPDGAALDLPGPTASNAGSGPAVPTGPAPPTRAKPAHTLTVARADGACLVSKVLNLEAKLGIELRIHIGSLADRVPQPQGFNLADPYAFDKDRFRLVVLPATDYAPARKCLQCPMGALLGQERRALLCVDQRAPRIAAIPSPWAAWGAVGISPARAGAQHGPSGVARTRRTPRGSGGSSAWGTSMRGTKGRTVTHRRAVGRVGVACGSGRRERVRSRNRPMELARFSQRGQSV